MAKSRYWNWAVNLALLLLLLIAVFKINQLHQNSQQLMLNCSSELYDRRLAQSEDAEHYLVVDLQIKGANAVVNYRYFDLDGSAAGSILMDGDVERLADKQYQVSINHKQELPGKGQYPAHLQYVSYISNLNLNRDGNHLMSLEILDVDASKDYAVVRFQPSNTVCGCRLMH
ncbi:hypothetical protein HR45_01760 [Shewanella mangrovi]|uniref:Uncharacterized protein n=1 Tax=Shewanella mangrovi TaxID=1515746 RepID=A0A094JGQ6_9GAMM|nr:hypothetical protein [Shewanella mangrovi]KFZ39150.1 hypothetical protein HR45_01760 [Shewanella mangrovi]